MLREEILAMEAGEELDRLVAVEVMDLICVFEPRYYMWPEEEFWYDMSGRCAEVKPYSTDILAAWWVVEKMPPPFQIHRCLDNEWQVVFGFDTWIKPRIQGKTAPEAICKAALWARMTYVLEGV